MVHGQIVAEIPALRRYAACLTGSIAAGDRLIGKALRAILAGQVHLVPLAGMRLALLRALHEAWEPAEEAGSVATPADDRPNAGRLIQLLPPLTRAAVILTRSEHLSAAEAAFVLRVEPAEIHYRLQAAEQEFERVMARRVLIVEDDVFTAIDLEDLVTSLGHRAIGPAMTRTQAVHLAMREEPDLILSDVRLDEQNAGIDAIREIRDRMNVPVIFLTAYPDCFADRAILDNSYVIPKPFSDSMVSSIITNALRVAPAEH